MKVSKTNLKKTLRNSHEKQHDQKPHEGEAGAQQELELGCERGQHQIAAENPRQSGPQHQVGLNFM